MPLIKCPECGKEFSSYSSECPVCGMPTAKIETSHHQEVEDSANEISNNPQKKKIFTKNVIIKLVCFIVTFVVLNIILMDGTFSVTFGGLLFLNAVIAYAIGFIFLNYKWAFLTLVVGIFVLMIPHKLIPTLDIINSDGSYGERRYAVYFFTKNPTGSLEFLNPTEDYIYNGTNKTLYLTTVGYGEYRSEPNKYTVIPSKTIVSGKADAHFVAPQSRTTVRSRGHVTGVWRSYLDYVKY